MEGASRAKVTIGQVSVELEGSEAFVREELAFFKEKWLKGDMEGGVPPTPHRASRGSAVIKEFMAEKAPENDMEAAAIVAYHLSEHQSITDVDGKILSEWFTKAGRKPPKNPYATLKDAKRRKGYFDSAGRNKYKLSDTGRYLVEHELPKSKGGA